MFCGSGAGRPDLLARCQGLPNVRFLDLQPLERLPDLLATADIHLLPQRADAADLALCESLGAAGYLYAQAHLDSKAVLGRFEADLRAVVGV